MDNFQDAYELITGTIPEDYSLKIRSSDFEFCHLANQPLSVIVKTTNNMELKGSSR